jgi:cytochrome P450
MRLRSPKDEQSIGIETGSSGENDPRRWFFAWGRGGRMCVGSHLASMVLKLLLASVYTNFTTSILEDDGMEHRDEMMASPVGDKLILAFNSVA